ncbi:hypothetical protein Tco_0213578 [Tanacetum coccineum]
MTDSQSPEERVRRVIPEYRVVRPRKGSATSFPLNNDHPPSTFVSQTRNTSRTINRKPNKNPKLRKRSHPSSPPEQIFASATQQMARSHRWNDLEEKETQIGKKTLQQLEPWWTMRYHSFYASGVKLFDFSYNTRSKLIEAIPGRRIYVDGGKLL